MKVQSSFQNLPVLTQRELMLLLAAAKGRASGYGIARQYEADSTGEVMLSNGLLYPALRRLEAWGLIESVVGRTAHSKPRSEGFQVTAHGRMVLELNLAAMRRMIRLAESRL